MKATHLLAALVAAGAACTALTGCGGDKDSADSAPLVRSVATTTTTAPAAPPASAAADPFAGRTGEEVMRDAENAMKAETSMTMDLRTTDDGGELHVTAALTKDGRCAAAVSEDGASFQVVVVAQKHWMKADAAFWKAHGGVKGDSVAKLMSGKWLKMPTNDDDGFAEFCSMSSFLDEMSSDDESSVVKGSVTTDGGHLVVPLTTHDEEEGDTVVEVAAQGPPRILKAYTPDDDSSSAAFTDFGKKFSINPPPASQVVDVSALGDPDFSV